MTQVNQSWPTDVIISVAAGRLCCNDIGDVYKLIKHMTGEDIMTHQLPRACDACRPYLERQFPWLENCRDEINGENYKQWTAEKVTQHGTSLPVSPLPEGAFEHMDPIAELIAMRGGADGIVVVKH